MTDEDRNRAVSLVAQGFTFEFVADEYGVFPTTIFRSLRKKFAENKWLCCSTTWLWSEEEINTKRRYGDGSADETRQHNMFAKDQARFGA